MLQGYLEYPTCKGVSHAAEVLWPYLCDTCRTVHPIGCPESAQAISWEEVGALLGAHSLSCSALQGLQNAGSLM